MSFILYFPSYNTFRVNKSTRIYNAKLFSILILITIHDRNVWNAVNVCSRLKIIFFVCANIKGGKVFEICHDNVWKQFEKTFCFEISTQNDECAHIWRVFIQNFLNSKKYHSFNFCQKFPEFWCTFF